MQQQPQQLQQPQLPQPLARGYVAPVLPNVVPCAPGVERLEPEEVHALLQRPAALYFAESRSV